ncbi:TnsD family Tn7-like transposition protein [Psychrobacillus sp. FSL H8-0510]|uniref:TnsD family Tn7-like transposition protein n=1 Tax=Psychrobacillus sp. FSL H8-0510 TaxID=2921394 RepID=UPI0030FB4EB7
MSNIISFPTTFPDEDFRSILYRYHLRSPHRSYLKNRKELLGKAYSTMVMYPENLIHVINGLGVSEEFIINLIDNHTFYPLFRPFVNKDLHNTITNVFYNSSGGLSMKIKTLENQFLSNSIRYCPTCLNDDYERFGEVYAHRTHQFSFLTVCPIHETKLVYSCSHCDIPFASSNANLMLTEPKCPNGHEINENTKEWMDTNKYEFLDDIKALMSYNTLTLNYVYQQLMVRLGNRGYIHFKGDTIFKKDLISDMVDYYGKEVLIELGLNVNELLRVMPSLFAPDDLRKHTIFYILLMRFLSGNTENFLKQDETYFFPLPFGNGPWVCNNRICPQYNQRVINICRRKVHEWITGYFTCNYCGMTYYRKGFPHLEDETLFSIETMGALFINQATKYINKGYTITQTAEFLRSNRTTVRKYLKLYKKENESNLLTINQNNGHKEILQGKLEVAVTDNNSKLELCKETVLEAISILGKRANRPQIRKYNIHRYDWGMKHDRTWMELHLPPKRKLPKMLNLESLDDEMYQLVSAAVDRLWENPPETKITKTSIFKTIPSFVQNRCYRFSEYLPRTIHLIERSLETDDQYLIRIFPKVVKWFKESRYKNLSLKLIQNGFKMYKKSSLTVIQWLEDQIDQINSS